MKCRKYKRRHPWSSPAELETLKRLYPNTPTTEIAALLGRRIEQVYNKASVLGLKKSAAYLASPAACRLRRGDNVGAACRFQKGHVPANKGLRRPGYAPGRMAETQFKKGRKSHTWKPIGTERINADGYLDRKISDTGYPPRDWRGVHILLWEENYGPIPRGYMVCFLNGDKRDIRLDNLMLLNWAERMRLNTYHNRYPKEIGRLIQLRGALVRQINRRMKDEKPNRRSA